MHRHDRALVRVEEAWPLDKVAVKVTFQIIDKVAVFEKQITVYGDKLTEDQRQNSSTLPPNAPFKERPRKIEIKTV